MALAMSSKPASYASLIKLVAVAAGMAISISCNTLLASMFRYVNGAQTGWSIALAALCMTVVVLCFAALSAQFPGAIGIRAFTKRAVGNRFSVTLTLFYVFMVVMLGALEINLCYQLLHFLMPASWALCLLGLFLLAIFLANLYGYELSIQLQIGMTLAIILMQSILIMLAQTAPPISPSVLSQAQVASGENFLFGTATAIFLFVGVEWAVLHVHSHQDYQRRLPLALLVAIFLIALLYGLLGNALQRHFTAEQLAPMTLPHLSLANALKSPFALYAVVILSLSAILSSFNVGLSSAGKILYSMAREGELPHWFAQLNFDSFVPRHSITAVTVAVFCLVPIVGSPAISQSISPLLSFHLCLVYAMVIYSWWKLSHLSSTNAGMRTILSSASMFWLSRALTATVFVFLLVVGIGTLADANGHTIWLFMAIEGLCFAVIFIYPRKSGLLRI